MNWAGLFVLSAMAGLSIGQVLFTPLCSTNGASYSFTLMLDLQNDTQFEYMTFKDSGGSELIVPCSTTNGQITGTGTSVDPFTITITVDPTVNINLGSPDCGHRVSGKVLTWTAFVVHTLAPPIPGASGREDEQDFICDFTPVPLSQSSGGLIQAHHLNLTQEANVLCSKNGTMMTMIFSLAVNNDIVAILFARDISNSTLNTVGTFDSLGNGITGNGSAADPYSFTISADCGSSPPGLTSEATSRFAVSQGNDVLSIGIVAKSIWVPAFGDMVDFADDVIYWASCNCSELQEYVVRTDINVTGSNHEIPNVITESATLEVWDATNMVQTTAVTLGAGIFLVVIVDSATQSTGQFVYSCFLCDRADCNGAIKGEFIDANGCSTSSPFFNEFALVGGQLRTNTFEAFRINNQNWLYFQCSVGFCYNPTDTRCPNFCAHNAGRRKRRQAVEPTAEEKKVTAYITFTTSSPAVVKDINVTTVTDSSPCDAETAHKIQPVWLIVVAITIAGLLLVDLLIHVAVLFRFSSLFRRSEKKFG